MALTMDGCTAEVKPERGFEQDNGILKAPTKTTSITGPVHSKGWNWMIFKMPPKPNHPRILFLLALLIWLVEATKVAQKAQVLQAQSKRSHSGLHRSEEEGRPRLSSDGAVEAQSKHLTCPGSAHSCHHNTSLIVCRTSCSVLGLPGPFQEPPAALGPHSGHSGALGAGHGS